ncbi:1010_t:CDS:2, partial [Dentiscutata heterogama]
MTSKDLTKPFYYGNNNESIESFMADYEGYAAMKDWDDAKKRLVIGLHVAEPLRDWVRNIVEAKNTWEGIRQVSQSDQEAKDTSRIDKLEFSISKLTKVVKNMSNNKNQYTRNQPRGSSQTNWHQRQGPERVLAAISKKSDDLNKREKGIDKENMNISGADVRYFEASETSHNDGTEFLKIEMAKGESIFDVRNWNLRKRKIPETEVRHQSHNGESDELKSLCNRLVNGTKNTSSVKIKEIKPIAEEELLKSYCGNVVYWNNSHECEDEMIKTQMSEVIMRLTKDRMNTLNINNKISNQDQMYLET